MKKDYQKAQRRPAPIRVTTIVGELTVFPRVFSPKGFVSEKLAAWMLSNQECFDSRSVLDMGCGSGIQGLTALVAGARHVTFADCSHQALMNTSWNAGCLVNSMAEKISVLAAGHLFEHASGPFDIIIFNQPFFKGTTGIGVTFPEEAFRQFFEEAKSYLEPGGSIIMAFLRGADHCPRVAQEHGYDIEVLESGSINAVQKGVYEIYRLHVR